MRVPLERLRRVVAGLDLKLLIGAAVVFGFGWAFVEIADEVVEGESRTVDEAILHAFRVAGDPETPIGPAWLANAARDVTALGSSSVLLLVTLAVAGHLLLDGKGRTTLFLVLAVIGGAALSHLLKLGFDRPRPEVVGHLDRPLTSSFPSGHSMVSAVVYLTLGALVARATKSRLLRIYAVAAAATLAGLVGISRVYLGVHYPTDVLAGWSAGAAWAVAAALVAWQLQRRGQVEPPGESEPRPESPPPPETA